MTLFKVNAIPKKLWHHQRLANHIKLDDQRQIRRCPAFLVARIVVFWKQRVISNAEKLWISWFGVFAFAGQS
jgi:hypothetical protein